MKTQIHDYTMEVLYQGKLTEVNFVFEIEPYWGGNYSDPSEGGYAEIFAAKIDGKEIDLNLDEDNNFFGLDTKTCERICEKAYEDWTKNQDQEEDDSDFELGDRLKVFDW